MGRRLDVMGYESNITFKKRVADHSSFGHRIIHSVSGAKVFRALSILFVRLLHSKGFLRA